MLHVKAKYRQGLICLGLLAIAFIVSLGSQLNPFSNDLPGADSSVFITIAQGMLKGKTPYIDFFDHKGPLLYFINCCGLIIGSTTGIWFLEFMLLFITAIFCYKIARLFTSSALSVLTTVVVFILIAAYFDYGDLAEEYALHLIMPSLYIFTKACVNQSELKRSQVFLLGVFFGLSLMLRPNMFGIWFGFCIVIFIEAIRKKQKNLIVRYILFFIFGAVISILPFIIYLASKHALPDFVAQYLTFNLRYATSSANETSSLFYFFNFYLLLTYPGIWILLCAVITFVFVLKRRMTDNYHYFAANALSIIVSICLICFSNIFYLHYAIVLIPLFVPVIAMSSHYLYNNLLTHKKAPMRMILVCFFFALVFADALTAGSNMTKTIMDSDRKEKLTQIQEMIEQNSDKNDKITVLGNSCHIYFYSERESASKYIYQRPIALISSEIADEYISDIKTQKPKMVIVEENIYEQKNEDFYIDVIKVLEEEQYKFLDEKINGYYFFERNDNP